MPRILHHIGCKIVYKIMIVAKRTQWIQYSLCELLMFGAVGVEEILFNPSP